MISLIWALSARASPTLEGETGLLSVPSAETVPRGRIYASLGLELLRSYEGLALSGLPVGFAAGLTRRIEVGGALERDIVTPAPEWAPSRGTAAFRVRLRALDPGRYRPAIALQGALVGVGQRPGGEISLLAAAVARQSLWVLAAGPRFDAYALRLWQGGGMQWDLGPLSVVLDEQLEVGDRLRSIEGRGGIRLPLSGRAGLLAWGGGGWADVAPWAGAGLALQLASSDPMREDIDEDTVLDGEDRCRYKPEDLDGFEDSDGCPDEDNDKDGIEDALDPTPNGEPETVDALPGDFPALKMRIKQRPMPGPLDPARRALPAEEQTHEPR